VGDESGGVGERYPALLRCRGGGTCRDGEVQCVVRGVEVAGKIDVGDVERVGIVIKAVGRSIGGEFALECDAREVEEIADGIFVFTASETSEGRARLVGDLLAFGPQKGIAEISGKTPDLGSGRAFLFLGRHFPGIDSVVDMDPAGKCLRVGEITGGWFEGEVSLAGIGVVAFEAVGLDEIIERGVGRSGQGVGRVEEGSAGNEGCDGDPSGEAPFDLHCPIPK
jgi:hypothetical protein